MLELLTEKIRNFLYYYLILFITNKQKKPKKSPRVSQHEQLSTSHGTKTGTN